MAKITIDDKEYETEDMNEEQLQVIQTIQQGNQTQAFFDFALRSIKAVNETQVNRLKELLEE